jgi:hypothetical protein
MKLVFNSLVLVKRELEDDVGDKAKVIVIEEGTYFIFCNQFHNTQTLILNLCVFAQKRQHQISFK